MLATGEIIILQKQGYNPGGGGIHKAAANPMRGHCLF